MRILFTGITGRLGSAFAELYHNKHEIVGVARHKTDVPVKHFIESDIRCHEAEIVKEAMGKLGGLDVIVNNAVSYTPLNLLSIERGHLQDTISINAIAPFLINQSAVEFHMKDHGGRLIHIGSFAGKSTHPKSFMYSASKAALNMLMLYERQEYGGFGVTSNVLCPTSFPELMPTAKVAEQLEKLINSDHQGKIVCLASEHRVWME